MEAKKKLINMAYILKVHCFSVVNVIYINMTRYLVHVVLAINTSIISALKFIKLLTLASAIFKRHV